ncbi:9604_t:CDS:2, partial [Racocetra persica]
ADVAGDDLEVVSASVAGKKRGENDDTIDTSTSKKRVTDSELVSQEEALSLIPPPIGFFPDAPASKFTTSAVEKSPKE